MAENLSVDDAVQATNDDATSGKRCAVELGYWKDPYLQYFSRNMERKAPEMNRGYYARTKCIKELLSKVIKLTSGRCQIVNLGAGFDTLYWRLKDEHLIVENFSEVDFSTVTARKCHSIKKAKPLLRGLANGDGDICINLSELHAAKYHLVSADLRNVPEVHQKLKEAQLDFSLPTVFIAECVLVYIEISHSEALLKWIADNFPSAVFINYEQVNMNDRFGQIMIENLMSRGCCLAGVSACHDLQTQTHRFLKTGWETARALNMMQVYNYLAAEDIARIEKLEFLDERELMEQLFLHYCVCVATKDCQNLGLSKVDF